MIPSKNDAVIWRGVRKNGLIKQFLKDVDWGELDFLVVDAPPGTSDEHITLAQYMKETSGVGAIIVTTPQVTVALLNVLDRNIFERRSVGGRSPRRSQGDRLLSQGWMRDPRRRRKHGRLRLPSLRPYHRYIPSGFRCGFASLLLRSEDILSTALLLKVSFYFVFHVRSLSLPPSLSLSLSAPRLSPVEATEARETNSERDMHTAAAVAAAGGEGMAAALGVPFLGRIPLDPALSRASEAGVAAFRDAPASPGALALAAVVANLRAQLPRLRPPPAASDETPAGPEPAG